MTDYNAALPNVAIAFAQQPIIPMAQVLADAGLKQVHAAETEKYAHVTYFFNGGSESVYPGEDRVLVPSPKVATYDLKPQMSAAEVTERLVEAIDGERYDAIVCNYANADMVGHTGNFDAAKRAIETLDTCIGRVVDAARAHGTEVLITSDHGNAERMHDDATGQAHTAHTLNLVPCIYVGRPATLAGGGALQDIAPTLLAIMGLPKPPEMTGHSLVRF
jgi:2,3-bisphosphoglycerate-independent phosphoglycerate mutase